MATSSHRMAMGNPIGTQPTVSARRPQVMLSLTVTGKSDALPAARTSAYITCTITTEQLLNSCQAQFCYRNTDDLFFYLDDDDTHVPGKVTKEMIGIQRGTAKA